jgi:hypothetical protein
MTEAHLSMVILHYQDAGIRCICWVIRDLESIIRPFSVARKIPPNCSRFGVYARDVLLFYNVRQGNGRRLS